MSFLVHWFGFVLFASTCMWLIGCFVGWHNPFDFDIDPVYAMLNRMLFICVCLLGFCYAMNVMER